MAAGTQLGGRLAEVWPYLSVFAGGLMPWAGSSRGCATMCHMSKTKIVARLGRSRGQASTYEQMIHDGRIIAGNGNLAALGAPRHGRGRSLSKIIVQLRAEESD